ncbi:MAG: class I SAM-dependent methyltransferase, partial [Acidobacteria bacterium]|nr:class I SAM-dependent methyltransferase [Acidobacteriota bacterium]
ERFYRCEYYKDASEYADCLKAQTAATGGDHDERVRLVSRLARRASGRVLDVGCAAGGLLAAFRRAGWQCCGVEPAQDLAAHARQAVGCAIHQGALETVALPEESFDAVTALHVLEHTSDPLSFLERCRRLLKKDGVLLVEVPDFGSRAARRQREAWRPLYPDTHLYHFTRQTLSRMLRQAGFTTVRFRSYGGLGALAPAPGDAAGPIAAPPASDRLKQRIFQARLALYRVPHLKHAVRYLYWHVLRMNDCMAICALRTR